MNGQGDEMKMHFLRGAEACALLVDEAFRAQWSALWHECPWATMFQSPAYVRTWYEVYQQAYEPLFVFSRDSEGRLCGLLTLAISGVNARLVAAGEIQAEYQVWISQPELGDTFPLQAVREIQRQLPAAVLRLSYLPPGAPVAWLKNRQMRRRHLICTHRRPLTRFGDGSAIAASLAKRTNKNRLRQIEKVGHVTFEHITDPRQMEGVIDTIIPYHDVRHMTFRGAAPFQEDPLRRTFALALLKIPGLVHLTVLKAGEHFVTAHLGAVKKNEVQLGLIAHNPRFARHSPGKFQILFLSKMLMQQGFEQLDLTAGGDPYKERFADAWDEVHTLALFPSLLSHARGKVAQTTKSMTRALLKCLRLSPNHARLCVDKVRSLRPFNIVGRWLRGVQSWISAGQEIQIYSFPAANVEPFESATFINRDVLGDLLLYQPDRRGPSRREFVSAAVRRIEQGEHCYTHVRAGRLLHCGWLAPHPSQELAGQMLPGYTLPPGSALIGDRQTFSADHAPEIDRISLRSMMEDAARDPAIRQILVAVPARDQHVRTLLEQIGFKQHGTLFQQTRFGLSRNWAVIHDSSEDRTPSPFARCPRKIAPAHAGRH